MSQSVGTYRLFQRDYSRSEGEQCAHGPLCMKRYLKTGSLNQEPNKYPESFSTGLVDDTHHNIWCTSPSIEAHLYTRGP